MHADEITEKILGSAFEVSNTLGCGFLEKVYERALLEELHARGLRAKPQVKFKVEYKGRIVGEYCADLLVEDQVIVELKCAQNLAPEHMAQCINYLKAANLKLALLLNFQRTKLEWKRIANDF
ncbi:MAG TPA: GxxExxY protein [Bryobacteraceae bacterium]|jgi:GxxExxY protein|nr:GxxExxY protein [Bryobacteraceae bacterium]